MGLYICFAPLKGGNRDSGRQMVLGCAIQRVDDGKFLDAAIGIWSIIPTINKLRERGRNQEPYEGVLRGTYVLDKIGNTEPWHDCPHIITYHEYDRDMLVVGRDVQTPTMHQNS